MIAEKGPIVECKPLDLTQTESQLYKSALQVAISYCDSRPEIGISSMNAEPGKHCMTANIGSRVAGISIFSLFPDDEIPGYIELLVVRAELRGRIGVGTRLLKAAEEMLYSNGAHSVELEASDLYPRLHSFYSTRGYRHLGENNYVKNLHGAYRD